MQRIDLYLPELRPRKEWLTASSLGVAILGMLIIFALVTAMQWRSVQELSVQAEALETQLVASGQRLQSFSEKTSGSKAQALDERVALLRQDIAQRNAVKDFLKTQRLGNEHGYAARLRDLSADIPESLYLESIRFSAGDALVEFSGVTRRTTDVAQFVDRLQSQSSFENAGFGALSTVKHERNTGLHRFSLGLTNLYQWAEERQP